MRPSPRARMAGRRRACHVEDAGQIDVDDQIPVVRFDLADRAGVRVEAGVVDENVGCAKTFFNRGDGRVDRVAVADVAGAEHDLIGGQAVSCFGQLGRAAADERDPGAFGDKGGDDRAPNARACTGDNDGLVFELWHRLGFLVG